MDGSLVVMCSTTVLEDTSVVRSILVGLSAVVTFSAEVDSKLNLVVKSIFIVGFNVGDSECKFVSLVTVESVGMFCQINMYTLLLYT